ncbi:MAG: helix-turn-helix domain-containing protein [Cyanobacteria bacterium P01_E01_bin.42]
MKTTTDAVKIIQNLVKDDREMQQTIAKAYLNAKLGQLIYDTRQQAGLTHKQLADALGIEKSILEDLEKGDYDGDGLIILQEIAKIINYSLKIELSSNESDTSLEITV